MRAHKTLSISLALVAAIALVVVVLLGIGAAFLFRAPWIALVALAFAGSVLFILWMLFRTFQRPPPPRREATIQEELLTTADRLSVARGQPAATQDVLRTMMRMDPLFTDAPTSYAQTERRVRHLLNVAFDHQLLSQLDQAELDRSLPLVLERIQTHVAQNGAHTLSRDLANLLKKADFYMTLIRPRLIAANDSEPSRPEPPPS